MVRRVVVGLILAIWPSGCGLEGPVVNVFTRDKSTQVPDAADNLVVGRVPGAPSGVVVRVFHGTGGEVAEVFGQVGRWDDPIAVECEHGWCARPEACRWAGGRVLPGVQSGAPVPEDVFAITLPGTSRYQNLRVDARWEGGHRIGLVPVIERQVSVLDPEGCWLVGDHPDLVALDVMGTAASLVLMGKALNESKPLSSFPPAVVTQIMQAVRQSTDPDVTSFVALVRRLSERAGRAAPDPCGVGGTSGAGTPLYPFAGALAEGARVCDLVDATFLEAHAPDVTPQGFASALLAAEAQVSEDIEVCYAPDRMRVVFLADFRPGALDGNCATVDPFKWAKDAPGKTVYFTGGVHKTTPVCGRDGTPPACLTEDQVDQVNKILGNWVPNRIAMHDDGTNGDAVRDDKVFTLVLDLPYFAFAEGGRGVRIGYKYTYGLQGQGWTQSEEWPGNQRLLEIVDVNGDHLVVRMDVFGDEATNKDKANLLKPSSGGCGMNYWEDEVRLGCGHDTRERMVDTNHDCVPDAWPTNHSASPILADCP